MFIICGWAITDEVENLNNLDDVCCGHNRSGGTAQH